MRVYLCAIMLCLSCVMQTSFVRCEERMGPLSVERQGSFSAGGTIVPARENYAPLAPTPQSQTLHGDHASVFYQIPSGADKTPLVFLHGAGQSSRTWESTPDGRDGFQNIFLRRGFPVYLVDQPRRGTVNRHGGDARLVHLPEAGIKGNTHFPFSDRNNIQIADLLSQWLKEKNLEK